MNHRGTETQRSELNELSHRVIGLCIDIHRELGPGLLESAYEEALSYELNAAGLAHQRQLDVPLQYKQVLLDCGYRLDFIIESKLILELKTVQALLPIHEAQVLTYLKLMRCPLALLINFNVAVLKDGVRRLVGSDIFQS